MSPTGNSPPVPERKQRKWLRRTLWALIALLSLVVLTLVGGYVYLTSGAGGAKVKTTALSAVNGSIKGRIEAGNVRLSARDLVFEDLKLFDPEGQLVAEIKRVEVKLRPTELLGDEYQVRDAIVTGARLYLKSDARGFNLLRAIEAKNLRPSDITGTKGPPAKRFAFKLDRFALEDAYVDFVQEIDDPDVEDRKIRIEHLAGEGHAAYATLPDSLDVALKLNGGLTLPTSGPVVVDLAATGEGDQKTAKVMLRVAGVEVAADVLAQGTEKAELTLQNLRAAPETVKAFVPSYPLIKELNAKGVARQSGNVTTVDLSAGAGKANVIIKGGFDIARFRAKDLQVEVSGVDLSELMQDGPKSHLALSLLADGGGTSLKNLDARVSLNVPESSFEGQQLGPVRAKAFAKDGTFHLPELTAKVPGLSVSAKGEGTLETMNVSGTLNAQDLATVARVIAGLSGSAPMKLSGHGQLAFKLTGPTKHPALALTGGFDTLSYEDYRVRALKLDAALADVLKPLEADGSLTAAEIRAGERSFRDLSATIHTRGRDLEADVTTKGLTSLLVHVGGTVDDDNAGLLVNALVLRYPEAEWSLEKPSHLRWPEQTLSVEPLSLRSGSQRLAVMADKRGNRVDARVDVEKLDLARLPSAFVDKSYALAGTLDATVTAKGRLSRPSVNANVSLNGGAFRELKNAQLTLDGSYADDRLNGTLSASADPGSVKGRFDVPVTALLKKRHESLSASVEIPSIELTKALAAAGRKDPVEGRVSANLEVTGYADDPQVTLTVNADDARYGDYPPKDQKPAQLRLGVKPGEKGMLSASLDATGYRSHALLTVDTPFTIASLRAAPPDTETLLGTQMTVTLTADHFELSAIDESLKGVATVKLAGHGSALAPEGTLRVGLAAVQRGQMPPLDGTALLDLRREVKLTAAVTNGGAPLLDLNATVNAPAAQLLEERTRNQAPLTVDLTLAPTAVTTLQALSGGTPSELRGVAAAHLTAKGSLNDPRLSLNGTVEQLGLATQALGRLALDYQYASSAHDARLRLGSPSGGGADVTAKTTLDLSAPAIAKGLDTEHAPLSAKLTAQRFDLAFLSGVTPTLRAIAGTLDADGQVTGTLGSPEITGAAEWKNGRIALMGYGDYRAVHLKALATNDRVFLEDLSMQSGGGKFTATADARRAGAVYALVAKAEMNKFPIIYDDQLFAIGTTNVSARGEVSSALVNITALDIPEAHLELPQIKRKDLQDLDRPDDIVLLRNGEFVDKKQAKRFQETKAAEVAKRAGVNEKAVEKAIEEPGREYRILINAPRNLWVRGADVNVELGLSEEFRIEYQESLNLFGSVSILHGRATVLGRRFDLQKDSQVRFQGPAKTPFINATAVYTNEREQVTVFMNIRGQGSDIALKPTSQPPLSESEIWTLLATGRRQLKRGSGASMTGAEAATIVSSAIASELRKTLPSKVPLDVLSIEGGEEGLSGSKLEAGTYVTDKIYVGYTGRLGANPQKGENSHAVRFEYQISPRWSFEANWGDANAGGADLLWTRDY